MPTGHINIARTIKYSIQALATLSSEGFAFLKSLEGYRNTSYKLQGEKYWTVGFGHNGADVEPNTTYSDEQCMKWFEKDSTRFTKDVNKIWNSKMSQHMFDAMFSFAYNHGNISTTALGAKIAAAYNDESKIRSVWTTSYCSGTYAASLKRRRQKEVNFYFDKDLSYSSSEDFSSNDKYSTSSGASSKAGPVSTTATTIADAGLNAGTLSMTSSESNQLALGTEATDTAFKKTNRIWQEFAPTIVKDELSWEILGDIKGAEKKKLAIEENNLQEESANLGKNVGAYTAAGAGTQYPVVAINDYYFAPEEIAYFEVDCTGFIPTLVLKVRTKNKELSKGNIIREGDHCRVFFSEDMLDNWVVPIRADFVITTCVSPKAHLIKMSQTYSYTILGELNVPDLHNSEMSFTFNGTSRDALRDAAQKLKLAYNFNNPENTNDKQFWQCVPQDNGGVVPYLIDCIEHSWMTEDRFFDGWIDPRYALNFIDISEMLGQDGPDEGIDVAKITTNLTNFYSAEGNRVTDPSTGKMLKIFNNLVDSVYGNTPFAVISYQIENNAAQVTQQISLNRTQTYTLNNGGIDQDVNKADVDFKVVLNEWKMSNGFYALLGDGSNLTYTSSDKLNGLYKQKANSRGADKITEVMSDEDQETQYETDSNELSSGNVSKSYDAAYEHNLINNMQLKKLTVTLNCAGLNLEVLRGEKVPCILKDNSLSSVLAAPDKIQNYLEITACGWFIISGLKWIYEPFSYIAEGTNYTTNWRTVVTLTRREWPIPIP